MADDYRTRAAWLAEAAMASRSAFVYICTGCHHRAHDHTLREGGDLRAGPYTCAHCACVIDQSSPVVGLSERLACEWDALPVASA